MSLDTTAEQSKPRISRLRSLFGRRTSSLLSEDAGTREAPQSGGDPVRAPSEGKSSERGTTRASNPTLEEPYVSELVLDGWTVATKHRLLTKELASEIRALMPVRLQLYHDWHLMYGLEQHGTSLQTLYQNCDPTIALRRQSSLFTNPDDGFMHSEVSRVLSSGTGESGPVRRNGYVIVIKDGEGNVFGAYVNEYLRAVDSRRFYGNGECFLWKELLVDLREYSAEGEATLAPPTATKTTAKTMQFKAFPYTGENDFLIFSNRSGIAIGSGGHDRKSNQFGLWIDGDLENGFSAPCLTFGNECLSGREKFKVYGLEVWRVGP